MERKPRFTLPGHTQHIIQRGLDRQACFFTPADCQLYLELLQEAAARYECHVHAYRALFSAHIAPDQLHAIRHTANQKLVPGSGAFKQQVENMLNRKTEERPRGRPRKARGAGEY